MFNQRKRTNEDGAERQREQEMKSGRSGEASTLLGLVRDCEGPGSY